MTPQQRHIEAAKEIVNTWWTGHDSSVRLVFTISEAIAEAENRAAWDGWDLHKAWARAHAQDAWMRIQSKMEATYGPRPSRGEVGNE